MANQVLHQPEHLLVVGQHVADHGAVGLGAGAVVGRHQAAAEAAFLPAVADGERRIRLIPRRGLGARALPTSFSRPSSLMTASSAISRS